MRELPLKVDVSREKDVAIIRLAANFYTSNQMAQQLRATLNELFEEKIKYIVINMNDVTSIDSEGLGTLSFAYKHCVSTGGNLVIAELNNRDVADVVEIVNLDKIIPIYNTQEEALQKVNNPA